MKIIVHTIRLTLRNTVTDAPITELYEVRRSEDAIPLSDREIVAMARDDHVCPVGYRVGDAQLDSVTIETKPRRSGFRSATVRR